jgi:hypothetical protein
MNRTANRSDGCYHYQGFRIRSDMLAALERYIDQGVPVGNFLQAVLENDLHEAVSRADDDNMANLPAFAAWLYNEAPAGSWRPGNYDRWIVRHREANAIIAAVEAGKL